MDDPQANDLIPDNESVRESGIHSHVSGMSFSPRRAVYGDSSLSTAPTPMRSSRTTNRSASSSRSTSTRPSRHGNMLARAMEMARAQRGTTGKAVHGVATNCTHMFADKDAEKDLIHKNIEKKEYDVADLYKEKGCAQAIARNRVFSILTLFLITLNSLWIGFEIQYNDKANLNDAEWYFQVGEYFFCAFFVFEWCIRCAAFERKCDGLTDKWFCFDAFLVFIMVIETLILPQLLKPPEEDYSSDEEEGQDVGNFSVLRMLRLLRLTRMVRFMRAMPELVTLVRSMSIACRPVLSTLGLLLLMIYMFAIVFKSQLEPKEQTFVWSKFNRVTTSMCTLFFAGTLLDNVSRVANALLRENKLVTYLFICFILLSSFTLLNLLVGMLCEVVNVVAASEKEKAMVNYVKTKLIAVLEELDEDGSGMISKNEFDRLMDVPSAVQAITDLGVDVGNLVSLSDHLFVEDEIPAPKGDRNQTGAILEEKESGDHDMKPISKMASIASRHSSSPSRMSVNSRVLRQSQKLAAEKEMREMRRSRKIGAIHAERLSAAQNLEPLVLDDPPEEPHWIPHLKTGLSSMGIDVGYGLTSSMLPLDDFSESEDEEDKELSFGDFIEMVIRLRSENHPSVIDIIDLRKLYLRCEQQTMQQLDLVAEMNGVLANELDLLVLNHPFYKMLSLHPDFKKRVEADRKEGRRRQKDVGGNMTCKDFLSGKMTSGVTSEQKGWSSSVRQPDAGALAKAISMADNAKEVFDLDAMSMEVVQEREANYQSPSSCSRPLPDQDALARAFAAVDGFEAPSEAAALLEARTRDPLPSVADPPRVNVPTEFELPLPRPDSRQGTEVYPLPAIGESSAVDTLNSSGTNYQPDETALGRALAMAAVSEESEHLTLESDARASSLRQASLEPDVEALQRALAIGNGDGWDAVDNPSAHAEDSALTFENTDRTGMTPALGDGEPMTQDVLWYRTGPATPDANALANVCRAAESARSDDLEAACSIDVAQRSQTAQSL